MSVTTSTKVSSSAPVSDWHATHFGEIPSTSKSAGTLSDVLVGSWRRTSPRSSKSSRLAGSSGLNSSSLDWRRLSTASAEGQRHSEVSTKSSLRHSCSMRVKTLTEMEPELLHASSLRSLLHFGGQIFEQSSGSSSTYGLSRQVDSIDCFISHNWSVPRYQKLFNLVLHFNLSFAIVATLLLAGIIFGLTAIGIAPIQHVPGTADEYFGSWAQLSTTPMFLLMLSLGHEFPCLTGKSYTRCFLDKTCIHQTDAELKSLGIQKLSAFLAKSTWCVALYSDLYLRKLWTIYEITCFLVLRSPEYLLVIHVAFYKVFLTGMVVFYAGCLNYVFLSSLNQFIPFYLFMPLCLPVFACGAARRFNKSLREARCQFQNFRIQEAECSVREDRILVERNIVDFVHRMKLVDIQVSSEACLEAFNDVIRNSLFPQLEASSGFTQLRYKQILGIIAPIGLGTFADWGGALCHVNGMSKELVAFAVSETTRWIVICPLCLRLCFFLMAKCPSLQGYKECLFVLVGGVVSGLSFLSLDIVGTKMLRPKPDGSVTLLLILVAYSAILTVAALYAFSRRVPNNHNERFRSLHINPDDDERFCGSTTSAGIFAGLNPHGDLMRRVTEDSLEDIEGYLESEMGIARGQESPPAEERIVQPLWKVPEESLPWQTGGDGAAFNLKLATPTLFGADASEAEESSLKTTASIKLSL